MRLCEKKKCLCSSSEVAVIFNPHSGGVILRCPTCHSLSYLLALSPQSSLATRSFTDFQFLPPISFLVSRLSLFSLYLSFFLSLLLPPHIPSLSSLSCTSLSFMHIMYYTHIIHLQFSTLTLRLDACLLKSIHTCPRVRLTMVQIFYSFLLPFVLPTLLFRGRSLLLSDCNDFDDYSKWFLVLFTDSPLFVLPLLGWQPSCQFFLFFIFLFFANRSPFLTPPLLSPLHSVRCPPTRRISAP